ncbi:LpqB family beta-propeller domain-containing protein [Nonomuraea soli]
MVSKRLATLVVAACVASTGASGCSVISLSSAPTAPVLSDHGDTLGEPFHQLIPSAPQPTWDSKQVVEGMQAAMAVFDDEGIDKTLWKYLTADARQEWKPDGSIAVLDWVKAVPDPEAKPNDAETTVTLTGNQIAEIKPDGRSVQLTDPLPVSHRITLKRVGQEGYRVSGFDHPRMLLTAADVERSYKNARLFYVSPDGSRMVGDLVKVRREVDQNLAESYVSRLLKGPSDALGKAVNSSLPVGAKVGYVELRGDRVAVNLVGGFSPGTLRTSELSDQLGFTLKEFARGLDIEVLHNGEPFFGSASLVIRAAEYNAPQSSNWPAYYLSAGQVYQESEPGKDFHAIGEPAPQGAAASDLAISPDRQHFAVRASDGIWMQENGTWRPVIPQADLRAPVWRSDGTLWTYDNARSLFLRFDPVSQQRQEIPAPLLKGATVDKFAFARDGVRVALIVRDVVGRQSLQVGAVSPLEVGNFQKLDEAKEKDPEEFRDIAWEIGGESLFLLTDAVIYRVSLIGGSPKPEIQVKNADFIAVQGPRLLVGSKNSVLTLNVSNQKLDNLVDGQETLPIYPAFPA